MNFQLIRFCQGQNHILMLNSLSGYLPCCKEMRMCGRSPSFSNLAAPKSLSKPYSRVSRRPWKNSGQCLPSAPAPDYNTILMASGQLITSSSPRAGHTGRSQIFRRFRFNWSGVGPKHQPVRAPQGILMCNLEKEELSTSRRGKPKERVEEGRRRDLP